MRAESKRSRTHRFFVSPLGAVVLATLILALLSMADRVNSPPKPEPAEASPDALPDAEQPLPATAEEQPAGEPTPAPVSQPGADTIQVQVLGEDSVQLSGEVLSAEELLRRLVLLADADRDESSWNRVSRREFLVCAPAETRWETVRRILLLAADPKVRIHRLFLALPGDPPVAITVAADWVSPEHLELKRVWLIDTPFSAMLRRDPEAGATRLELLGEDLGGWPVAQAPLRNLCQRIWSSPGNSGLAAQIEAEGGCSFGAVIGTMETILKTGFPSVSLFCLMPPYGSWPIGTPGWNLSEEALSRSGEERTRFLLDALWSGSDLAADTAEQLLVEEGIVVLPPLIARMERDGLPPRAGLRVVSSACGMVRPDTALLHSFGEDAVSLLIRAASSPSAAVRGSVVTALGGFPESGPEVEEILGHTMESDPDPEVRRQAGEALSHLRSERR